MANPQAENLVEIQGQANQISAEISRLSAKISDEIQAVSLGQASYVDVQDKLSGMNQEIAERRSELERIWSNMDESKLEAARREVMRKALKCAGLACAIFALIIVGSRNEGLIPSCLLGSAVLLAMSLV
jgi:chromosome segregation ATPase